MYRSLLIIVLLLSIVSGIWSQVDPILIPEVSVDSTGQDTLSVIIMEADTSIHVSYEDSEVDTLYENVILTQDSLAMYCNLAIVVDQIDARAYEDVVIIHHDTIQIYADSMYYDGEKKIADLFGEVILQDGTRRLYTSELRYNVEDKTAYYLDGGTFIDGIDTIISKEGYYYQREQKVRLKGNVSFVDTSRVMYTDSILYLYDIEQLNIIAPTEINQDSVDIYCEAGIYRLKQDRGVLSKNVQVKSGDQLMTSEILDIKGDEDKYTFLINPRLFDNNNEGIGDTIIYYDKDGILELRSDAVYTSAEEVMRAPVIRYNKNTDEYQTLGRANIDTEQSKIEANDITSEAGGGSRLKGNVEIYDKQSDATVYGQEALKLESITKIFDPGEEQPLLNYRMTSDSLLLRSDSLILSEQYAGTDSSFQDLSAVKNVKWRNGSTLGKCGYFKFDQKDSLIVMTDHPILWSDSTQLTADTIILYLKNNDVYKISLISDAMIVTPDDGGMYNQIKGAEIENFIDDKILTRSHVMTNAELFYMIKEEESYRGVNLTKSNEMIFTFEDDEISKIDMDGQPTSNMYEYIPGMDVSIYNLEGFKWRIKERPSEGLFIAKL